MKNPYPYFVAILFSVWVFFGTQSNVIADNKPTSPQNKSTEELQVLPHTSRLRNSEFRQNTHAGSKAVERMQSWQNQDQTPLMGKEGKKAKMARSQKLKLGILLSVIGLVLLLAVPQLELVGIVMVIGGIFFIILGFM